MPDRADGSPRWIAGEPMWIEGEDGLPWLDRPPVVLDDSPLSERWVGGAPRFAIDADFYMAVQRGELSHLIDHAEAYRHLTGDGDPPREVIEDAETSARLIWICALGLVRYEAAWSKGNEPRAWGRSTAPEFYRRLGALARDLGTLIPDRRDIDFATIVSAPAMIRRCRFVLGLNPGVALADPLAIPPVPTDIAANTTKPKAAKVAPKGKRGRPTAGDPEVDRRNYANWKSSGLKKREYIDRRRMSAVEGEAFIKSIKRHNQAMLRAAKAPTQNHG